MSDQDVVRFSVKDGIGIITIDYPPVNALGPGVSDGICAAVDKAEADPSVKASVLIGAGRTFIAGADIKGFDQGRKPSTRKTYDVLDAATKPVVAAIHGYALGGGLENALACHYRVAVPSAKVGLPEVLIGIIPGGGGTQRLPRLIGAKTALDEIVAGRHIPATEARELGIVDELVEGDLLEGAIAFANKIAGVRPLPRVRDKTDKIQDVDPAIFEGKRKEIARRMRGQPAPSACIDAVKAATELDFDAGIAEERRLFEQLVSSDEAKALRYAFFAEREIARVPHITKGITTPEINTMAVVGAGTMGGGIAMSFVDAGIPVKLTDASPEVLEKGLSRIRDNYARSVKRGSLSQEQMDERMALIQPVETMEEIGDCDAVIEAVFERMPVKQDVFRKLDEVMKPEALLFTNTSALDIDQIAAVTGRPEKVAGTHYFVPANVMKLFEVVEASKTSPETLAAAMALGRRINKISGYAGNCDGFAANRSRIPFTLEQNLMIEEGALPEQIDEVMKDFGYPVGPFQVNDMSGLDISYDTRQRRKAADPNYRMLPIPDRLVEAGRVGLKAGKGWYRYEDGDRTPHVDPEVHALIKQVAEENGIAQREFSKEEILHRLLFGSLNEFCKILEEGKALRASDLDVMWLHGFGFPRYRGGLMYWGDTIGAEKIYNQIAAWHQRYGDRWRPSELLRATAQAGGKLHEIKSPKFFK
jgi:3-hydroxyacyl-CoA dehydrogenase